MKRFPESSRTRGPAHLRVRRRGERGAVLVMSAVASVALVMSAAVAVDVGSQRSKRAQFQAAADGAALLAIYQINNGYTYAQVSTNVKNYVLRNLGVPLADWANCDDVKQLEVFAPADIAVNNDCISFRNAAGPGLPNQSRVKIPVAQWNPLFGMGIVTMRVSAVAGAEGAQGVCDEFDLAGCVTTTTTTTIFVPSTTTTSAPPPYCPPPNTQHWDSYWGTWECAPPAPYCPPANTQYFDGYYETWECQPGPPYCNLATSQQFWDVLADLWKCIPFATTTTGPTTIPPPTTAPPPTTSPPPPPTSIEIEF